MKLTPSLKKSRSLENNLRFAYDPFIPPSCNNLGLGSIVITEFNYLKMPFVPLDLDPQFVTLCLFLSVVTSSHQSS